MKENMNTNLDNQDNKKHKAVRKKIEKKRERKKENKKIKKFNKKVKRDIESKINTKDKFIKRDEKLKKYIKMFLINFEEEKEDFLNLFKILDKGGEVELDGIENIQVKLMLKKIFKYMSINSDNNNIYRKHCDIKLDYLKKIKKIISIEYDSINEESENNEKKTKIKHIIPENTEFLIKKIDKSESQIIHKVENNYNKYNSIDKNSNQLEVNNKIFEDHDKKHPNNTLLDEYNEKNNKIKSEEIYEFVSNTNFNKKFSDGTFQNNFL